MALSKFTKDMDIIAALDDEPNDVGGLTAAELKAKFDEGGKAVKEYLNDTLLTELDQQKEDIDDTLEGLEDSKVSKTTKVNGHPLDRDVTVTKGDVGLGNVDNTADADKPVSTAQQKALDKKADKSELNDVVLGEIPDGSLTEEKLSEPLQNSISKIENQLYPFPPWYGETELESGVVPESGFVEFWCPFSGVPQVLAWSGSTLCEATEITAFGFQAQAGASFIAIYFTGRDIT